MKGREGKGRGEYWVGEFVGAKFFIVRGCDFGRVERWGGWVGGGVVLDG